MAHPKTNLQSSPQIALKSSGQSAVIPTRPHGKSVQESLSSADLENENARVFTAFPVSLAQTFSSALEISRANNPIRGFTV